MAKKDQPEDKWQKFSEQQQEAGDQEEHSDVHAENIEAAADADEAASAESDALTAIKMERDTLKEQVARARAEVENMRRRSERDVSNAHKYGSEKLLSDLLPVVDSLIRGLEGGVPEGEHAQALHEGMRLTHDMLEKMLLKHGVMIIDPAQGDAFNPDKHEAMSMQKNPDLESNTVIQVLQKGFELNGRVLRAAMVIVNQ